MGKFLRCFVSLCLGLSFAKADYIATVIEYNHLNYTTPNVTLEENVNNYVLQIRSAYENNQAQIVLFPEYGLTGWPVDPAKYSFTLPNVGTSDFEEYLITRLSDAARTYSIYVVVNLLEKASNGKNETIYYNTNAVFANNGTLVAKYRKINLVLESVLTPGNETVSFTTDFGTFGLLTCADIFFYHPSQSMFLNNPAITDVIYPAAWTTVLPFYSGLQVQTGYSLANKINLLAANLNQPSRGSSGSAIYHRNGNVLARVLAGTPSTQAISANLQTQVDLRNDFNVMGFDVIENRTTDRLSGLNISVDFNYNIFAFKSLKLSAENITEQICHGRFCCSFNILAFRNETNESEIYKLVAYDGRAPFDDRSLSIKFCTLIACASDDVSTCGMRPTQAFTTKFRRLLVWGNYENQPEVFYRPATLRGDFIPVSNITYLENRINATIGISLNSTKVEDNLLVFGLFARGAATSLSNNLSLVLAAIFFFFIKCFKLIP